ncbi:MAG: hypothetical protein BHV68_14195 [Bacteroidales bacterium 43_8]|nr:MAG: hypothetical protein BHV68_14195 [Bacteroidales bacterium 43_8]
MLIRLDNSDYKIRRKLLWLKLTLERRKFMCMSIRSLMELRFQLTIVQHQTLLMGQRNHHLKSKIVGIPLNWFPIFIKQLSIQNYEN